MIEFRPIERQLLTAEQAAEFLLLSEGRSSENGVRALKRYVDRGLIRPTRVGRSNRYWVEELLRFIRDRTEARGA